MNTLSSLLFKFTWRSYQARFLKDFQVHLEDNHLHVVAPPGSGKTILGLEMMRRINKKTLVLSPTLTIRNQWNERMLECFVKDENSIPISFDIKNPETITFSTYQSLHSFYKNELESSDEKILRFFENAEIENIVLDEAHHLKNEWWKPLFSLKQLPNCTLISLTATPPYDSEQSEIAKYFELCGPIDMEIGLPELVKEGNLCPHQDYIYFSKPEQEQIRFIIKYREQLIKFVSDLKVNEDFKNFILKHPYYANTEANLEAIYEHPDFYSAILIYLNSIAFEIPPEKIELLGVKPKNITFPSLSYEWVEALLQPILVDERELFIEDEILLKAIEKELRKIGTFDNKRVNLVGENNLYRSLSQSPSKLKSIVEITKIESSNLGNSLRMVILSDYIRKEFLDFKYGDSLSEINKLGVIPIFQHLRNAIKSNESLKLQKSKLAVLTGSLILIHNSLVDELTAKISAEAFTQSILWDTEYIIINPTVSGKKEMVSAMTQLFEEGFIEVLIGTKSLLGEGWDAPAINTLILASFVGSFVTSNQMRGRAIRVNPLKPEKVANVWHIACVDPTSEFGGADIETLTRRFDAFCGISLEGKSYIENGIERLGIANEFSEIEVLNEKMKSLSLNRKNVKQRWETALEEGKILIRELKLNFDEKSTSGKSKKLYYRDLVKYAFVELSVLLLITLPELFINNFMALFSKGILYFFYAVFGGLAVLFLPKTIKALKLYIQYGRRDKQLFKFAEALKTAMVEKGIIKTPPSELKVVIEEFDQGDISCFLKGATVKESLLFINYLEEIIAPVENPRYIITQASWFKKRLKISNYYNVPKVFAERKSDADLFFEHWKNFNGNAILTFTRNTEGRKLLLKARFHYYQETNNVSSKKALIWK
ncbi:DNA/RNA helicase, superfamily II [Aequorivita sublithincola DSM 14238]|uniref:DNA/RNA helicase, superfamily II n=1 Tax=Aequorivita sublithincola (strain DSM 14238 / LMG 21431 / ACAM 643 / 9-3) TaxID=746697 RepID=I3YUZ2_AEQSU|nr:DEAD/DEAH box helicase family protein [Aequorivita sublithincola]AFL80810.1 DNA/RNA helicase, superfamily II [Aequorivita sublithincola DSM 14238]